MKHQHLEAAILALRKQGATINIFRNQDGSLSHYSLLTRFPSWSKLTTASTYAALDVARAQDKQADAALFAIEEKIDPTHGETYYSIFNTQTGRHLAGRRYYEDAVKHRELLDAAHLARCDAMAARESALATND